MSGIPARIPSRLGEPGSLFSRYKFLQLRLVVVMLLTRTRRELLKRRTIGAYIYISSDFLESRVTRHPLRHCRRPPPPSHPAESSSRASFRRLHLLIPGMRIFLRESFSSELHPKVFSMFLCDLHFDSKSSSSIAIMNLYCVYHSASFPFCIKHG